MRNIKAIIFAALIGSLCLASCSRKLTGNKVALKNNAALFPKGEKLSGEWFTGEAFLYPLLGKDKNNGFSLGSVTFEPNARTNWHTHPKGQVLIVTEGEGIYQEKDKPARRIRKGDVINIPENVEHWHGATAHSKMVHIALTNYQDEKNATWLSPVTDVDYNKSNNM